MSTPTAPRAQQVGGEGRAIADLAASPRFQRHVQQFHRLGARPLAELLAEIVARMDRADRRWLDDRLAAYRRLSSEMLAATGGDRFPAPPLTLVA